MPNRLTVPKPSFKHLLGPPSPQSSEKNPSDAGGVSSRLVSSYLLLD